MRNECKVCSGSGSTPAPQRRWYQFWKTVTCDRCEGDGYARPPSAPIVLPTPPQEVAQCWPSNTAIDQPDSVWIRTVFTSVWTGPYIVLVVVQDNGSSESWKWTARGYREPDEGDSADEQGWVSAVSQKQAEKAALAFYLEKE